jgi:hypothetical protein
MKRGTNDPIEVQNLDCRPSGRLPDPCAGGGCCPDAIINEDRTVTLTEGVFAMTLEEESCRKLARLLKKHGYLEQ